MRFAGALLVLALGVGPTAFAQDAPDREQRISELQKQLDSIAAQLRELQGNPPPPAEKLETRLDGAVRQSPSEALATPRRLNISAPSLEGLDITGLFHTRGEAWGNYDIGNGNTDGVAFATEIALGFDAKIGEKSHVYIEPYGTFGWGDNVAHGLGGPTGTGGTSGNFDDIEIAAASLNVQDLYNSGWGMNVGRQKLEYGAERMIGDDEWSFNRTRFDGFRFDKNLGEPGNLSLIAMRVQSENFAGTPLHPGLFGNNGQDEHAEIYGAYYSSSPNDRTGTFDIYLLHLEDPNVNSGVADDHTRWTTYGGRYASPSMAGISLDAEAATQFGEFNGADTNDAGFDVWALHGGLTFKPEQEIAVIDSVFAGYDYATGGDDVNDQHSFVQLYPSLHGWFGITDMFSWSNIIHGVVGANFKVEHGVITFAYHWNRMASAEGSIQGYNTGLNATGSTDGRNLGQEADVVYSVPCTKTMNVDLGAGYFMPGDAYASAFGTDRDDMVFAYLQFRASF